MHNSKTVAVAVFIAMWLCAPVVAQTVIYSAYVDQGNLTITGKGLTNLARTVTFNGQTTRPVSGTATQIVVALQTVPSPGTYRFTVGSRAAGFVAVAGNAVLRTKPVVGIKVQCGPSDGVCNVVPDVFLDANLTMVLLMPDNNADSGADGGGILGPGGTGTVFLNRKRFTFRYLGNNGHLIRTYNDECDGCSFSMEAIEIF